MAIQPTDLNQTLTDIARCADFNRPAQAVADIALSLPEKPTSGDILAALMRAEAAGYARACREMQVRP